MTDKIDTVTPAFVAWREEWQRNRDMIEGARVVKSSERRTSYLPKDPGLTDDHHKAIAARTPFFPGASRCHEGLLGLLFRKPSNKEAPAGLGSILETITPDYLTVDDLAEEVASEFLLTNFVGLLVDLPASDRAMSVAEAQRVGVRPVVSVYRAETIIKIEPALIGGGLGIGRVVLQEGPDIIRELWLDQGIYTVTMWSRPEPNADYVAGEPIQPLRAGAPIANVGIPFVLVSTNRRFAPAKAKLSDVCDLNGQHYIASANLAQCSFFASNPTPYLFGPAKIQDVSLAPGTFLKGEIKSGNDMRIGMLEYSGVAIDKLMLFTQQIASDMAKVGARILADERAGVEGSETLKVKMASENAALASTARLISRKITDALKWVAYWLGYQEGSITYEVNTDFGSAKLTKDEIASLMSLYQAGVISRDTLLDALIEGETLPESFDKEADADRIAQEVADRPPVIGIEDDPTA
jgi:hypothetical protein